MPKYEYLVVDTSEFFDDFFNKKVRNCQMEAELLNKYGQDGWELVTNTAAYDGNPFLTQIIYYFKRSL